MADRRVIAWVATGCLFACGALAQQAAAPMLPKGAEYYVSPAGNATAKGTKEDPWDLVSVAAGKQPVKPGDTVWVRGGAYRYEPAYKDPGNVRGMPFLLAGTAERPIIIRAVKGERAILDGGVTVSAPAAYLWLWGLEIAPAEEIPKQFREMNTPGSNPEHGWPIGGITITGGKGCKYINLHVHDNLGGGFGLWTPAIDAEVYGCIIANNGWKGPDRPHGHCIYTQNKEGTKLISNNIMITRYAGGQFTMHAYGSKAADVSNFLIQENIFYLRGPFLVASGRPNANNRIERNCFYKIGMGVGYKVGNLDCYIRDNTLFNGGISVTDYKKVQVERNLLVNGGINVPPGEGVVQKDNRLISGAAVEQEPAKAVLLPNMYDPDRAHLAIFNWANARQVEVKVEGFLKPGDAFRLFDPERLYDTPAFAGVCAGPAIRIPMTAEFAVFVVLKGK